MTNEPEPNLPAKKPRKKHVLTDEDRKRRADWARKIAADRALKFAIKRAEQAVLDKVEQNKEENTVLRQELSKEKKKVYARNQELDRQREKVKAISIVYAPHLHQWKVDRMFDLGKRYVGLIGGVRCGKTWYGARRAIKQIYSGENMHGLGWIVSPTYPMSLVAEREFVQAAGPSLIVKKKAGDRAYFLRPRRGTVPYMVEIKSAENPDRLRGANLDWVWIDEAAMISKECWDILRARVLASRGKIWITTTPAGKSNWTYSDFYVEACKDESEYGVVKARTVDNLSILSEDVERLRAGYSEEFAAQELDAEFVSFEGLIYKKFDPASQVMPVVDVIRRTSDSQEWAAGVDWGFNDPFVFLFFCRAGGTWYVVDEYYLKGKALSEHIHFLKQHPLVPRLQRVWCDPSRPENLIELNRGIGKACIPANNDIDAGLQNVASIIESKALVISSGCVNTLSEMGKYCWRNPRETNSKDKPIDAYNHAMDALRYAMYGERMYAPAISITRDPGRLLISSRNGKFPVLERLKKEEFKKKKREALDKAGWPVWYGG